MPDFVRLLDLIGLPVALWCVGAGAELQWGWFSRLVRFAGVGATAALAWMTRG